MNHPQTRSCTRFLRLLLLALALLPLQAQAQSAEALAEQSWEAYQAADYARSGALADDALDAGIEDAGVAYNGACAYALAGGHEDDAFRLLDRAVALGWSDADHLQRDADLTSLHDDPRWDGVVRAAVARGEAERRRWAGTAFETPYRDDLSVEEKQAGLARLWAEVRFNFINFDLVPDLDWDSLYLATVPRVAATASTADYYRELMAMVARLRDGHSNVYPPDTLWEAFYASPPLRTRKVGDAVAVVAVYDEALRAEGVVPGVEVVAVDGVPVEAYAAERVRPYQSASTAQDLDTRTYEYALLSGPVEEPVEVTFRRADGAPFTHTLSRRSRAAMRETMQAHRRPSFDVEWLDDGIAYVSLNSFGSNEAAEAFAAAFDRIAGARALVFDVRENGGGNSGVGWAILAHLTDEPFPISNWRTLDYRPAYRAWGRPTGTFGESGNTYPADASAHFTGPVAVLTSPRTFSAAEDFAVAFDAMGRGRIVGEPTGGSTGQPLFFSLPGGGSGRVTTKRDTYPDGTDFVGVGVQPDLLVRPTLDALRAGRDPVLEAALEALREPLDGR